MDGIWYLLGGVSFYWIPRRLSVTRGFSVETFQFTRLQLLPCFRKLKGHWGTLSNSCCSYRATNHVSNNADELYILHLSCILSLLSTGKNEIELWLEPREFQCLFSACWACTELWALSPAPCKLGRTVRACGPST